MAREAGVKFHWLAGEQSPAFIRWVERHQPEGIAALRAAGWDIEAILSAPQLQ